MSFSLIEHVVRYRSGGGVSSEETRVLKSGTDAGALKREIVCGSWDGDEVRAHHSWGTLTWRIVRAAS